MIDHVGVGQDVTVRGNQETGTLALAGWQQSFALRRHELAEEIEHLLGSRHPLVAAFELVSFLGGGDVDHGGRLFFHQVDEVRQLGRRAAGQEAQCQAKKYKPFLHVTPR